MCIIDGWHQYSDFPDWHFTIALYWCLCFKKEVSFKLVRAGRFSPDARADARCAALAHTWHRSCLIHADQFTARHFGVGSLVFLHSDEPEVDAPGRVS
jgi:hypothetical protein